MGSNAASDRLLPLTSVSAMMHGGWLRLAAGAVDDWFPRERPRHLLRLVGAKRRDLVQV